MPHEVPVYKSAWVRSESRPGRETRVTFPVALSGAIRVISNEVLILSGSIRAWVLLRTSKSSVASFGNAVRKGWALTMDRVHAAIPGGIPVEVWSINRRDRK